MPDRCAWVPIDDPLYVAYHDDEWGAPLRDRVKLFELLCLEGAQAGLSWRTVLHRRAGYRAAFLGFSPERVAGMDEQDAQRLTQDTGIVRNRAKIAATIGNAHALLRLEQNDGPFVDYIWQFVDGTPLINRWQSSAELPVSTDLALRMSRDLKRRGFKFVGPTICYSFMQAAGLVMDHEVGCFRYEELSQPRP